MDIVQRYGLTAAVVDAAEGTARCWAALPDVDMVRVNEPAAADVPGPLAAGFTLGRARLSGRVGRGRRRRGIASRP